MSRIACRGVTLGYDGVPVVEGLDFAVEEGDYLCIVGENGAGKSTLMKGLLGLLKPMAGDIRMEGISPTGIGFLPQQTRVQRDFPATVWEVALSGCQNRGGFPLFYRKNSRERTRGNLDRLGVAHLKNKSYRDLSGGQQQRVLLARALCAADSLLLLDEPMAGLDPMVTAELYDLLESLNREGVTVLMISHDIAGAVNRAGKILHLRAAQLFFGPVDEYRASPLGRAMLGGDALV